jgi:hypothetical protein
MLEVFEGGSEVFEGGSDTLHGQPPNKLPLLAFHLRGE